MMRPRLLGLIGTIVFVVMTRAPGLESAGLRDPAAQVTHGDSARADFVHAPGYRPEIERRRLTRSTSMPPPDEPFGRRPRWSRTGPDAGSGTRAHACYEDGAFFTMDGTRTGGVAHLPLQPEQVDVIYDSEGDARAWIWGIALDAAGNPVIVYATFRSTSEHTYRYARWDGQAWNDHVITGAGGSIDETRKDPYYSAGVTLDPENPNYVYLCRDVDGVPELERWITTDGGSTWVREPITTGSTLKNARPVVPRNRDPAQVAVRSACRSSWSVAPGSTLVHSTRNRCA